MGCSSRWVFVDNEGRKFLKKVHCIHCGSLMKSGLWNGIKMPNVSICCVLGPRCGLEISRDEPWEYRFTDPSTFGIEDWWECPLGCLLILSEEKF